MSASPVVLLSIRNTPRAKDHLSSLEILYQRLFLSEDLEMDLEIDSLLRCIIDVGTFQQAIWELGNKILSALTKGRELN
jgi:hypothetical protein